MRGEQALQPLAGAVVDIVTGSHARIRLSDFAHLTGRALR
jgi:hypothetical protein